MRSSSFRIAKAALRSSRVPDDERKAEGETTANNGDGP